jgi:hypothetical protein
VVGRGASLASVRTDDDFRVEDLDQRVEVAGPVAKLAGPTYEEWLDQ